MRTYSLRNLTSRLNSLNRSTETIFGRETFPFKALIAIFWDLQPLWPSSLTKPDLLRFRCSSGHVLSKTKSVTPHLFYISDITKSSSFNGKVFRKKSKLENFRANVLKESSNNDFWLTRFTRASEIWNRFAWKKIVTEPGRHTVKI